MTVEMLSETYKRLKRHDIDTLELSVNQVWELLEDIADRETDWAH